MTTPLDGDLEAINKSPPSLLAIADPAFMVASPPFDTDDGSTDSDNGPPEPVDTENSPPTPFPNCEGEPVFKLIEPLVMPSLGVMIITSPDADDALIPEDSKMEPPWSFKTFASYGNDRTTRRTSCTCR
jgi:hypothetical protein